MKWKLIAEIKFHWCCWNDEYILFNSSSGDTHKFDIITAQIVKLFEQSTVSLDNNAIQTKIKDIISIDDDISSRIKQILSHLKRLDIIENVQ